MSKMKNTLLFSIKIILFGIILPFRAKIGILKVSLVFGLQISL